MKAIIEELIKDRIETYKEAMKKEEVKIDMGSQMYLRGALEELKFIEQNIIQLEPQKVEEVKLICRNCKSTAIYQEVGTFICGECNASW